jgi:hypothetical protein
MDSLIKEVARFRLALTKIDTERSPVRHILALARGVESSADQLSTLEDDGLLSMRYGGLQPLGPITRQLRDLSCCLSDLEGLLAEYQERETEFDKRLLTHEKWIQIFSPQIRSIGGEAYVCSKLLPEVYEKHFRCDFGVSRTVEGDPDGPGFRFVKSVLEEFRIVSSKTGQPLGDEAIATHLTRKARKKSSKPTPAR